MRSNQGMVTFALPQATMVSLRLFNMQGKLVKTIISEQLSAGYKTARLDLTSVSNVMYVLEFKAGSYVAKKTISKVQK